jgi:hypothetical protein
MAVSFLTAAGWILAGTIVLFLPGWAYLAWFPHPDRDAFEGLAESAGLSLAFTALGALSTFVFRFRLNAPTLIAIYAALALIAAAGWLRRKRSFKPKWQHLLALAGLGALVAWRLYQARSLVLPAWVDSLHHALIVRKMLDYGGLPADMQPYLPVPLYYHFAFHSLASVFAFFARIEPAQAVLLAGQTASALVALSVYRLGKALWPGTWRAVLAALLVGFFTEMPAYYLTWGRYTLAAGLVVLPLAIAAALDAVREPGRWEHGLRLAIYTAGALLAHYLTAILLAIFLIVLGIYMLMRDLRRRAVSRLVWASLLGGSMAGLFLALPWVLRVWQYSSAQFEVSEVLPGSAAGPTQDYINYVWYLLGPKHDYYFLAVAALGLLIVWRWRPVSRTVAIWAVLVGLLCLPWGLRLGPFQPHHIAMVLFLPAVFPAADFLISGCEAWGKITHRRWPALVTSGLIAAGVIAWGAQSTVSILNPVTVLATQTDREALDWVAANTPANARFYINGTPWQGGVYRGVDGGAWLLPLTGRWSLVPPPMFAWGDPGYVKLIDAWDAQGSQVSSCNEQFWQLVDQAQLDYIYVKTGVGSLQPSALQACPGIQQVYDQQGVSIYQIIDQK